MKTLYDLLGALPHDDTEALRTAFRRAVKGAHPDLRPGDPDAALKFRQIIRANEILTDAQEREAYDYLLELARVEQVSASKHAVAATIYRLATGVIALTGASVATVGGYLLFIHISAASIAPVSQLHATMHPSPEITAAGPTGSADVQNSALPEIGESASIPDNAVLPNSVVAATVAERVSPIDFGPPPDLAARYARALRTRGISAYRHGDVKAALADLDQALQLDPKYLPAYIDRGIIFYRQRKFDRAFADITRARRIEKPARSKSAAGTTRKPRFDNAAVAPSAMLSAGRRTAAQDPSRGDGFASVMR
ncbi:MAG TPA: DnaJ domain-containing protein [Bradyrhizobium sp.]|nr:DnaJ domain-containing protein [Bradyrhizobium sp.]